MATASSCIWMITGTVPNFPTDAWHVPVVAPLGSTGNRLASEGLQAQVPGSATICSKAWPSPKRSLRSGWFWWFSDWFQKVLKVEAFGAPCFYAQCIPMPELRIGPWPCFYAPHGEGRLWILGYNFCTYTLQSNGTCSRPFLAISLLVSRLG